MILKSVEIFEETRAFEVHDLIILHDLDMILEMKVTIHSEVVT